MNAGIEKKTVRQSEPYGLDVVVKAAREILGLRVFDDDVVAILCAPYIETSSRRMPWVVKAVGIALVFVTGGRIPVSSIVDYRFRAADGSHKRAVLRSAFVDTSMLGDRVYVRNLVTRMAGGFQGGKVALGGILPSLVKRHGIEAEIPGNCLLAQDASADLVAQATIQLARETAAKSIAIIGVGDLGREVARVLHARTPAFELIAYDKNGGAYRGLGGEIRTAANLEELKPTDLYVVLSGTGDSGLDTVLKVAKPGAVVLSDTYPKVSENLLRMAARAHVRVYDAHYAMSDGRWRKPFAGYEIEAVPGCLALALAESAGEGASIKEKMASLGLRVTLISRNGPVPTPGPDDS